MSIAQSPKSGADSDAPGTARALLAPGATLGAVARGRVQVAQMTEPMPRPASALSRGTNFTAWEPTASKR